MSRAPTQARAPDAREALAPTRVGVAGLGYWGPNIARNVAAIDAL